MASITNARTSTFPASESRRPAISGDAKGPMSDFHPAPPSKTVKPITVTTPPRKAATQLDSGGHVTQTIVMQPARKTSFSQKVVGYAKILRNSETKDYGGKIRKCEEPQWPPPSHHDDAQSQG
ncbi:hypothetical protein GSI_04403 [Ganoderma sinense ZZ0214-1]|uniref:Uncharacterized protein n=1 Tax=Ganoderma sinense ZZ0214-1 TaxID=1077348 RepID=A0A2G8SJP7_9APHY|nr:hypothetical protein GSI_04403 [Ganoderma sinense ZZ0214-1]